MEWLSVAEAALELGVSERQVRRLVGDGLLRVERVGNVWLVTADAVCSRARDVPAPGRPLSAPMALCVRGPLARCAPDNGGTEVLPGKRVELLVRSRGPARASS